MNWQILVLLSVVFYSISVLLQKVLLKDKKSDPIAYAAFFQFLTGLVIGLYGYLFKQMVYPDFGPVLLQFLLMILLYGFGNLFIFKALKRIEASKYIIIFTTRGLFTVLASSFILSETLNSTEWLGTLLILAGAILVTTKSLKFQFSKGEAFALLAAMSFGFANTNDRILLNTFEVVPYLFLGFVLPALMIIGINPKSIKNLKVFLSKTIMWRMGVLSIVYAATAILFFKALQIAENSSNVVIANLTSVIVTVMLAIIFLKERENMSRKILGAILGFIGLVLVT